MGLCNLSQDEKMAVSKLLKNFNEAAYDEIANREHTYSLISAIGVGKLGSIVNKINSQSETKILNCSTSERNEVYSVAQLAKEAARNVRDIHEELLQQYSKSTRTTPSSSTAAIPTSMPGSPRPLSTGGAKRPSRQERQQLAQRAESDAIMLHLNANPVTPKQAAHNAYERKVEALENSEQLLDEHNKLSTLQEKFISSRRTGFPAPTGGENDERTDEYNEMMTQEAQSLDFRFRRIVSDPLFDRSKRIEEVNQALQDFGSTFFRTSIEFARRTDPAYNPGAFKVEDFTPYCVTDAIQQIANCSKKMSGHEDLKEANSIALIELSMRLRKLLSAQNIQVTPDGSNAPRATGQQKTQDSQGSSSQHRGREEAMEYISEFGQMLFDILREPTYVVRNGDTWDSIGQMFNREPVSLKNHNGGFAKPIVGNPIRIPRKVPIGLHNVSDGYRVEEGETIDDVSARHDITSDQLIKYNGIRPGAGIFPGQTLFIPPKKYPVR